MTTNINLTNQTNDLVLVTQVSGGLESSAYGIVANTVSAQTTAAPYLWFNRSEGVTNGKTFIFTTSFALAEISFTVTISLTGTLTQSNYWLQVVAHAQGQTWQTPQITDTGVNSMLVDFTSANGSTLTYHVTVTRFLNGLFDDVTICISPGAQELGDNLRLPPYDAVNAINLLDVWGEGRIVTTDNPAVVTGFIQAYNLNKVGQMISNGPHKGQPIPNLVPVMDYDNPVFPLQSGSVIFMTLMGAPISPGTAKEMVRVLDPVKGVLFLYDPSQGDRANFEAAADRKFILKTSDIVKAPFDQPTLQPTFVYGVKDHQDHDEL